MLNGTQATPLDLPNFFLAVTLFYKCSGSVLAEQRVTRLYW